MGIESHYNARFNLKIPKSLNVLRTPAPLDERLHSLPAESVNVGQMLNDALEEMRERIPEMETELFNSEIIWGEMFSYRNLYRENPKSHFQVFEPRTGAIRIGSIESISKINSKLKEFYEIPGRTHVGSSRVPESRGARYYVAVDSRYESKQKVKLMKDELSSCIELIRSIDRATLPPEDFLAYLGIIDNFKQHSLVALHALTYRERSGQIICAEDYSDIKKRAMNLAIQSNKMFYQCLLGRAFDDDLSCDYLAEDIKEVLGYLNENNLPESFFKIQEIDHPLIIGLTAFQNAKKHPNADFILGIPSGGTQIGIATHLAYEIIHRQNKVDFGLLPISLHSSGTNLGSSHESRSALDYLKNNYSLEGKNVLVTEDNTNTGRTAQLANDSILKAGASAVSITFAEADFQRVIYKQRNPHINTVVANLVHPSLGCTSGIVPIYFSNGEDTQVRKRYARRVIGRTEQD